MVFTINFPANLTDEEEILLKKYAKLKKKLQKKDSQTPKSGKPEPPKVTSEATKRAATEAGSEEAKEQAKKLLKSGAIKIDESREKQSFKRSKNFEKKLKDPADHAPLSFQPFSSQYDDDEDDDLQSRPYVDKSRDEGRERGRGFRRGPYREPAPKRGNTLYVRAQGITEEIAKKLFSKYGQIINISMEENCGFITYESMDASDQAIKHLNDSRISDLFLPLQVSIARRQPTFESTPDPPMSTSWSSIAASTSSKGNLSEKDNRVAIVYDDDIF